MNRFINAGKILTTDPVDLFVCGSGFQSTTIQAVVHTLFFSTTNLDPNVKGHVTVQVFDASTGETFNIGYLLKVLPNETLSFDKPINLDTGDILRLVADRDDEIHVFASILQIVPMSL